MDKDKRRGFAAMDPDKRREIASKGGVEAHRKGSAHEWTSEEAREHGRKGGMTTRRKREQEERERLKRLDDLPQADSTPISEGRNGSA